MTKLESVPWGLEEIYEAYGDPEAPGFHEQLGKLTLPFYMLLSWDEERAVTSVLMHKKIVPAVQDALQEVLDLLGEDKLHELGWDRYGGVLARRSKKGSKELSTHAWGIAIDLNPHLGPFGKRCPEYPMVFVEAFERRNFIWGGRWRRPDCMHFQACGGY